MNLYLTLQPSQRNNSKWVTDLNVKCKTIKFLEHNIGENLGDLGYGKVFLDTTPKTWSTKEITDKLDLIKIKNHYSAKDTIKWVKRVLGMDGGDVCTTLWT